MFIRLAAPADASSLSALATQVWLCTYATSGISSAIADFVLSEFSVARFKAHLSQVSYALFVAEINNHMVGYANVKLDAPCPMQTPTNPIAELQTLYVQEPFARAGVGSSLLTRAQDHAKANANAALWLTVNARNVRAMRFYAKHDYRKIGTTYFKLGDGDHENNLLIGTSA